MKTCSRCKTEKSLSNFYPSKHSKSGFRSECKTCKKKEASDNFAHTQVWNSQYKSRARELYLTRKYNITLENYNALLVAQDNLCAICNKAQKGKALAVDHCHKTGKIRALLCVKCNIAIGSLDDNIETAVKLVNYLKRFS